MKKLQLFALGSLLLLVFGSCKKENMTTNDSKKAAVNQQQASPAQPQAPPQTPPSTGCHHASASASAG